MIVIGTDTHKQSHTAAAVSEATGRALADVTVHAKRRSFDDLLLWARGLGEERVWAIEDCRHVSGALERFLLARGERVVRVLRDITSTAGPALADLPYLVVMLGRLRWTTGRTPTRRGCVALASLVGVVGALTPSTAAGHGPCDCLEPVLTQVGAKVRLTVGPGSGEAGGRGWPAYKVIFNPRLADLGIAPDYLTSAYREDAPTVTVLSRSRRDPTRTGSFRVPKTREGLYMVLIFDGSEGGAHNSWDYLHVVDPVRVGSLRERERTVTVGASSR